MKNEQQIIEIMSNGKPFRIGGMTNYISIIKRNDGEMFDLTCKSRPCYAYFFGGMLIIKDKIYNSQYYRISPVEVMFLEENKTENE